MQSSTEDVIRVFLVDALSLVRTALRDLLDDGGDVMVVGEAGSLAEAQARIPACRPDVVALDLSLPDGDGVDLVAELAAVSPVVRSLVLTSDLAEDRLFAALRAGANGVLHKNDAPEKLRDSVARVAAGDVLVDAQIVARLVERVRSQEIELDPRLAALTPTERTVLECLAGGLRNREIAATIHMSTSTVKNHVSSVLRKLGVSGRTEAAVVAVDLLSTNGTHQAFTSNTHRRRE